MRSDGDNLVLEVSGDVVGYATLGPSRTRGRFEGEIYELYMAPPHQGLGFGECLFEACRYRLDERRLSGLLVWALAEQCIRVGLLLGSGRPDLSPRPTSDSAPRASRRSPSAGIEIGMAKPGLGAIWANSLGNAAGTRLVH